MPIALRSVAALAAAVLLAACGCEREPAAPAPSGGAARGDAANADTTRIVSLSPAISIILRDLGRADEVVGRHAWEMVLDPALPVCGDQSGLDYERLISARPTHVLTQWGSRDLPARLATLAAEKDWIVEDFSILSLAEIRRAVERLDVVGRGDGPVERSPRAAELLAAMDEAWSRGDTDLAPAGRVLLLISVSPASALGPGSWHHEILVSIGGVPAITQGAAYISLDREDLLRVAPDAVVLIMPRPTGAAAGSRDPSIARAMDSLVEMGIVPRSRIAVIDDPLALTPSTAMIGFARDLRGILAGWAAERSGAGGPATTDGAP